MSPISLISLAILTKGNVGNMKHSSRYLLADGCIKKYDTYTHNRVLFCPKEK